MIHDEPQLIYGIVSTNCLWDRTQQLISSPCLRGRNILIASEEPNRSYLPSHSYSDIWNSYIDDISEGLYFNASLLDSRFPSQISPSSQYPAWMRPRSLRQTELSLYSKHIYLITNFLRTHSDFLLVMEDDLLPPPSLHEDATLLVNRIYSDYYCLCGNGKLFVEHTPFNYFNLRHMTIGIAPPGISRTACCFMLSRRLAGYIIHGSIQHYIIPFDWMINLAMVRTNEKIHNLWVDGIGTVHGSAQGLLKSSNF